MPTFEIQTPAGLFRVDAPDQMTALQQISKLAQAAPDNSLAGSAKALGTGLVEGTANLGGLPADLTGLAAKGVDYLRGTDTAQQAVAPFTDRFGSQNIQRAIESQTGPLYQPQTGTEKALASVGSFAPAALAGPGGLARRVATQVVAPGLASEAAGQLAQGTGYEPVAKIAGALAGGVGASMAARAATAGRGLPAVPAAADITVATRAGYNTPAIQSLEIAPAYADRVATTIENNLRRQRFSPTDPQTATVYGLVNDMRTPQFGANHTLNDFDATRRRLNEIVATGQGSGAEAARQAVRTIDAATIRGIPRRYVVSGDAAQAGADLAAARSNAAAGFRSDLVAQFLQRASNTAAATHSGANLENEIYKQVRSALNSNTALRGWSPEEREALRAVLPGVGSSILRSSAKVLGGGGGLGQLASGAAGAAMFGPLGAAAFPLLGRGLNMLGSSMAQNRLQSVGDLVRSRSALYGPANYAARQAALGGGLLAGLPPPQQLALQGLLASRLQAP